jgi:hypothetical protein
MTGTAVMEQETSGAASGLALPILPGSTPVSLALPLGMSEDEYTRVGQAIHRMGRAVQWYLGDWLLYGEGAWGERYAQFASETGFSEEMLAQCQRVASRFAPPAFGDTLLESDTDSGSPHVPDAGYTIRPRRRDTLSWTHHHAVAALPPAEADRWLDVAEKDGLSVSKLRERVKAAIAVDVSSVEPESKRTWQTVMHAVEQLANISDRERKQTEWVARLAIGKLSELKTRAYRASVLLGTLSTAIGRSIAEYKKHPPKPAVRAVPKTASAATKRAAAAGAKVHRLVNQNLTKQRKRLEKLTARAGRVDGTAAPQVKPKRDKNAARTRKRAEARAARERETAAKDGE